MRLLLQRKTGKFDLREFPDDTIRPYAIRSHTWLAVQDGEETTYDDLISDTGKGKLGYKKIQFCGEQARQVNLHYFWVDTCCINKANCAKLQHALNSVFPLLGANAELHPQSWDSEFWKSRWFTRGWTLQELLAHHSVEFFSRERERLGVPGIPIAALQGAPLLQFTVDERFSWMEHRQTTLEVDRVYSLLGILDIIDKQEKCIKGLRLTDCSHDKKRIEDIKGGLLEDSYRWTLENSEFEQ
ncbi:hypothetical protein F5884DRAFT_825318 [Xylogone sp. PMI_703]|nr:hypothetical protein F5884DRAFT_825318 [Xylogone sp. PMI_703]